jgi:hypothetical protein
MIITFVSFAHNVCTGKTHIQSRPEDRQSWSFSWMYLLCPDKFREGTTRLTTDISFQTCPVYYSVVGIIYAIYSKALMESLGKYKMSISIEWLPLGRWNPILTCLYSLFKINAVSVGIIIIIIIYLTANGFLPRGSGTTIRHNTQSNTPRSNETQHTKLHTQ